MTTTRRRGRVCAALVAAALALGACASAPSHTLPIGGPAAVRPAASPGTSTGATAAASADSSADRVPSLPLGRGFLNFPGPVNAWVAEHRGDPRAAAIAKRIAAYPTALWLTGDESFGNLRQAVAAAGRQNRTMLLTLYDIPMRYDGLSRPSTTSTAAYESWVHRVATTIGRTRAVIVLEPDALWFYDRMSTDADRAARMTVLRYAVSTLAAEAPRARVYLDAGTSSGSVTPGRMAALLLQAGVTHAAGYAVNVSSYAPAAQIQRYAQQIRSGLRARGVADPRYVVDTGRNGASTWNADWCNPSGQRLGVTPRVVDARNGLDFDLWVKAPGTSDGDCGPVGGGAGSYGGEFLPRVAYEMIEG